MITVRSPYGHGMPPAERESRPAALWIALSTVYLVWGSTYFGIRIVVETIPPLLGAAIRFTAAAVILGAILAFRSGFSRLRVTMRQAMSAGIVGLCILAIGNGILMYAEQRIPSGIAALLVATVPLVLVLFRLFAGDRPDRLALAGVGIGFVGLLVLVTPASGGIVPLAPAIAMGVLAIFFALGTFLSPRLDVPKDPFVGSVYQMGISGLALFGGSGITGEFAAFHPSEVSEASLLALGHLIVAGSLIGYTAYVWVMHHAPLSLATTHTYVNPIVAVALGALILSEPISRTVLIGGGIVIAGVALVISAERPKTPIRDTRVVQVSPSEDNVTAATTA